MILMLYKLLGLATRGPFTPQGGATRALLERQDRAREAQHEALPEMSEEDRSKEVSELMVLYLQPSDQDAPDAPIFMKVEAEYALYLRMLFDVMTVLSCLVLVGFIRM